MFHFILLRNVDDVHSCFPQKKRNAAAAKTYEFKKDFSVNETENSFDYQGQENIEDIRLAMPGKHQISNASLAITAALLLSKTYPKVTKEIIKSGLAQTHWVGRTELMFPNVMIDGAHNNESVQALVNVMQAYKDKKFAHFYLQLLIQSRLTRC